MKRMKNTRQTSKNMLRRGNAMIMVVGILVLLVIIATSYIVRTNSGRVTSVAVRKAMQRDDKGKTIAEMLADTLALQLFVREYDGPGSGSQTVRADSNFALLSHLPLALRYEVDQNNPYNFPPFHVIPYTNWPDPEIANPFDAPLWPSGPGNAFPNAGTASLALNFEGNPVGNPGFGDNRALADNEPLRWTTTFGPGSDDAYSHWRHMSNIATANNGFRIVFGINDIGDNIFDIDDGISDGIDYQIGRIITDLGIPFEQWLTVKPAPSPIEPGPVFDTGSGNAIFRNDFYSRWYDWFFVYKNTYSDPARIPPNFYKLSYVGLPQDEFIAGTARHAVGTILADTDGDGFTDAFWMLAPTMTESGIRQIIAVRIIDNSAMLNVNVGTQFVHADPGVGFPLAYKTRSVTPADLQLVGDIDDAAYLLGLRVGYLDNSQHHENGSLYGSTDIGYDSYAWNGNLNNASFLAELGVRNNNNFPFEFETANERLLYWQAAGSNPFDPQLAITPFSLTEELELRAYHGQNSAWIVSRLEKAIQENTGSGGGAQFLHANLGRHETSEYLDQLNVRELLFDHRKRLTTYSGARNDLMPPWLWWRGIVPANVSALGQDAIDNFRAQSRTKMDLREMLNPPLLDGEYDLAARLPGTLLQALTDGDHLKGNSYFGSYTSITEPDYENTQRAAAAFTANILQWSDDDAKYVDLQTAAVPLPGSIGVGGLTDTRFLGIERQPFLVEAFIGHVYKGFVVPPGYLNSGNHVIDHLTPHTTIVVVQIANPFDDVLELNDFRLRVFDDGTGIREVDFNALPSQTLLPGKAMTLYAMAEELEDLDIDLSWVAELELNDLFAGSINVTKLSTLSQDRGDYDLASNGDRAIEILRRIPLAGGGFSDVVVDRIDVKSMDDFEFRDKVVGLPGPSAHEMPPPPDIGAEYPGDDLGSDTHWIEWVNVTRAWHDDFAAPANMLIDPVERNPRYVFSKTNVNSDNDSYLLNVDSEIIGFDPGMDEINFHLIDKKYYADEQLRFSLQMLQKDDDFEQTGELLNVFMFGHELLFDAPGDIGMYTETKQTFSEFMIDKSLVGEKERVNRLRVVPYQFTGIGGVGGAGTDTLGQVIGVGDPVNINDPLHGIPAVPAGARVLDAFVCDGPGINLPSGDDYLGANSFSGKLTPGFINVNTAAQEVMRAIPHNSRLVHEVGSPSLNPNVRLAEAITRYRDRVGNPAAANSAPGYGDRGDTNFLNNPDLDDLRDDRGIVSLAELLLLERPSTLPGSPLEPNDNYRISFAGLGPFTAPDGTVESTRISIDLNDIKDAGITQPDEVAKDVEEQNLLFAGMSNLITTRSDVFTVYFRIRSFRQNPVGPSGGPVWDATDPEFIVDDSRYVMLVDRSEVNRPTDKPKILYLEKLSK